VRAQPQRKVGCNACIEICSAEAISSDKSRQQIKVNPNLCVGCGACTTVCPTGALTYAYPRAASRAARSRRCSPPTRRPAAAPVLLLHSQEAARTWSRKWAAPPAWALQGVPANVIPLPVWHVASTGIDLWLTAVAQGAAHVALLTTSEEAPQYLDGAAGQMQVAQAILEGLGYEGSHFSLLQGAQRRDLDASCKCWRAPGAAPAQARARFAVSAEKRTTLELALDHLLEQAPQKPEAIALPAGAPFGGITVDKDKCTLCLSCVGACPASALQDNQLRRSCAFVEKNCVQCGLCVKTCPEQAITLQPRLLLSPERKQPRVLNEAKPYACIRCAKPFGTLKGDRGHARQAGRPLDVPGRRAGTPEDVRRLPRDRHLLAQNEARITGPMSEPLPTSALDEETARAEIYGLLSQLFYAPPRPELLAALRVAVTEAPAQGGFLEEPWRAGGGRGPRDETTRDREEYDALFGGVGKPEIYLFGSHYLSGFLNEKPVARLRTALAELGLDRDEAMPETEDHIAYVCEVMRYLIAGDDVAVANLARQREFFAEHLQPWAGRLCDAITRASEGALLRRARRIHPRLRERRSAGLRHALSAARVLFRRARRLNFPKASCLVLRRSLSGCCRPRVFPEQSQLRCTIASAHLLYYSMKSRS
jgi:TorA maturation chaperone TorD/ferredoxin